MSETVQSSLFGNEPSHVKQNPVPLTATQRKFQRLSADIEAQKAQLRGLHDVLERLQSRAAGELFPIHERFTVARSKLAQAIDAALRDRVKLGRVQRATISRWLTDLCDALLMENRSDETLRQIYDRHADQPWEEMHKRRHDFLTSVTEEMARGIYGDDMVDGHNADNAEDLLRYVHERLSERGARPDKQRRPSKRQQEKLAQREREEKEASQSVREIYRKLASAVHPDRETHPTRRADRTALMQRINGAYEANDLLGLLALQREAEGFAADDAMTLSEERLNVFVRVLDEQCKALHEEVAGLLRVLRQVAGERGHWLNTPADFERDFDRGLRETKQELREIENDLPLALNPATVHQYLVELAASVRRIKELDRRSERGRMRRR